jgi:hypothetical protein
MWPDHQAFGRQYGKCAKNDSGDLPRLSQSPNTRRSNSDDPFAVPHRPGYLQFHTRQPGDVGAGKDVADTQAIVGDSSAASAFDAPKATKMSDLKGKTELSFPYWYALQAPNSTNLDPRFVQILPFVPIPLHE